MKSQHSLGIYAGPLVWASGAPELRLLCTYRTGGFSPTPGSHSLCAVSLYAIFSLLAFHLFYFCHTTSNKSWFPNEARHTQVFRVATLPHLHPQTANKHSLLHHSSHGQYLYTLLVMKSIWRTGTSMGWENRLSRPGIPSVRGTESRNKPHVDCGGLVLVHISKQKLTVSITVILQLCSKACCQ